MGVLPEEKRMLIEIEELLEKKDVYEVHSCLRRVSDKLCNHVLVPFEVEFLRGAQEILSSEIGLRIEEDTSEKLLHEFYYSREQLFNKTLSDVHFFLWLTRARKELKASFAEAGLNIPQEIVDEACQYFLLIVEQQKKAFKEVFPREWEELKEVRETQSYQFIQLEILSLGFFKKINKTNISIFSHAYMGKENNINRFKLRKKVALEFLGVCAACNKEFVEDFFSKL